MPKGPRGEKRPADVIGAAVMVGRIATGEIEEVPKPKSGRVPQRPRRGQGAFEKIAAVGDYLVALATYRAAVERWPNARITLRNRARVIEKSWRAYDGP